jgi:hypothetical protein
LVEIKKPRRKPKLITNYEEISDLKLPKSGVDKHETKIS